MENKIIELYLSGIGSTTICKLIPNVTKRQVLKILKKNNLTRNRLLGDDFYKNYWMENNMWCGFYTCTICNNQIKFCVNEKSLLNRNLKRKKECKKCSLSKQIGEGNPFFNKKHSKESKNLISKKRIGICTSDHMSKQEYKDMFSNMAKERWDSGKMEETRTKLSILMKKRIANGELKSFNRSKPEFEIIKYLESINLKVQPSFIIESKIFDIYIPDLNLLIEYNGDYWHCNPKKYNSTYYNKKKGKTAKEIWEYDKNKLDLAKKYNYNCFVIWESDYKKNKNIIRELISQHDNKHY